MEWYCEGISCEGHFHNIGQNKRGWVSSSHAIRAHVYISLFIYQTLLDEFCRIYFIQIQKIENLNSKYILLWPRYLLFRHVSWKIDSYELVTVISDMATLNDIFWGL